MVVAVLQILMSLVWRLIFRYEGIKIMEFYEKPNMEIVELEANVITTSCTEDNETSLNPNF